VYEPTYPYTYSRIGGAISIMTRVCIGTYWSIVASGSVGTR